MDKFSSASAPEAPLRDITERPDPKAEILSCGHRYVRHRNSGTTAKRRRCERCRMIELNAH
jgi:hypothetical protein